MAVGWRLVSGGRRVVQNAGGGALCRVRLLSGAGARGGFGGKAVPAGSMGVGDGLVDGAGVIHPDFCQIEEAGRMAAGEGL